MADRTSAGIFRSFFKLLAENPTTQHKHMALILWNDSHEYDFMNEQLSCEDELEKLGLARRRAVTQDGEEHMRWFYGPPGKEDP